ncbi:MAG: aminotransferase class I/II-fold pyridoxal phosphate-dependent enzyme [SAR324 cluster bacterium]|nr:aminotransferase class I/II-fold pyridoxal phosphate-dependent enzyme [SAR324 cluster bacterium]
MNPVNHQHGGSAAKAFKEYGLEPLPYIDFSVNINPLGPPPELLKAWGNLASELHKYPSTNGAGVIDFYQNHFGLERDSILPLNGSVEGIYLLPKFLKLKRVLIPEPSFFDYRAAVTLAGGSAISLPTFLDLGLDISQLKNSLNNVDGVFLGLPQNPTGAELNVEDLITLIIEHPHISFLIDLAFFQFLPNSEDFNLMPLCASLPNLFIFHSLTKFYAIPALRVGALLGPPEIIKKISATLPPWRINNIVEPLLGELQNLQTYEQETRDIVESEQLRIRESLKNNLNITLYPSRANFILAEYKGKQSFDGFLRDALAAGVFLRDARNFNWLKGNFFRFAILKKTENDQLLSFLKEI